MEEDEEGNERCKDTPEEELDEVPLEDKCLSIITKQNGRSIYVLNDIAGRYVRSDIFREMVNLIEPLKVVDLSDFDEKCNAEANRIEEEFCDLFSDDVENESKCPRIPVFVFRPSM
jgi:hypothetical protein